MRSARLAVGVLAIIAGSGVVASRADDSPGAVKPSAQHKILADDVGTWDAVIKSWLGGPTSEPSVSKGVETNSMVGGLWLASEFKGEFGGMTFEGRGQTGYDAKKGKYVGTWVDSMSTEIMIMAGDLDEKTQTMTMMSKGTDPAGKPYESKSVSEHKGPDSRVFTMYMKSADTKDEFVKLMEITYTRRAK
jgi:hypothetical protein